VIEAFVDGWRPARHVFDASDELEVCGLLELQLERDP
jgi:hypothetical protein